MVLVIARDENTSARLSYMRATQVKEAQVDLYIAHKRSHEQSQMYKDLRDKKKEGEAKAKSYAQYGSNRPLPRRGSRARSLYIMPCRVSRCPYVPFVPPTSLRGAQRAGALAARSAASAPRTLD